MKKNFIFMKLYFLCFENSPMGHGGAEQFFSIRLSPKHVAFKQILKIQTSISRTRKYSF